MNLLSRPFRSLFPVLWIALFLCLAGPSEAQSSATKVTVHLDPQKTEIHWTLHSTLHTVNGIFRLKGGVMTFDPATGAAQGEFLVDVKTGESDDKTRDGKMQNEVLESEKYPGAFFHPLKISGVLKQDTGTQNVTVSGTFNIHGADHPITLPLAVQIHGSDATATTRFIIPYVAWGMKDESRLMLRVDKEVSVEVVAHGSIEGISQGR